MMEHKYIGIMVRLQHSLCRPWKDEHVFSGCCSSCLVCCLLINSSMFSSMFFNSSMFLIDQWITRLLQQLFGFLSADQFINVLYATQSRFLLIQYYAVLHDIVKGEQLLQTKCADVHAVCFPKCMLSVSKSFSFSYIQYYAELHDIVL